MIIIRRVVKSKSSANFASLIPDPWDEPSRGGGIVHRKGWGRDIGKDERLAKEYAKQYNRRERRDAKKVKLWEYKQPNPTYSPDPIYEQQVRQYQFKQNQKQAPNAKQVYDQAAEDVNKAREKFSENTRKVADEAKENASKNLGGNKSKIDPRLLLAGLGLAGAVGAGAYFIRRRRSKNGKQIIERVRRK